MAEVWKAVEGLNGEIFVSNCGKLKSHRTFKNTTKETTLKSQPDPKGYLRIKVCVEGKNRNLKVHREVAKAFIPNPDNLPQVNHKDGNKRNNNIDNLEWVGSYENAQHAIKAGLWSNVFMASKATNEKRKTPIIATFIATGETMIFQSMSDAEREIGTRHINEVMSGKRSHALGFSFRYASQSEVISA